MKSYPSIIGPRLAPQEPCVAFYKYDGSNIRAEWSKKEGWYKFGTRKVLLDPNDPLFGGAVKIFNETLGDGIAKVLRDNKNYLGVKHVTVYCEYFGPNSFAMWHDWDDLRTNGELVLIDVNIDKRGFVIPRQFVKDFGHLKSAEVIYEGNFNKQLVRDVWEGKYPVKEGIVAKGVLKRKSGRPEHGYWMAKCKTSWWIEELKRRFRETDNEEYRQKWKQILEDNLREQQE